MVLFIGRPTWQSLDLQIGTDGVKVVTKDRRIIELSFQEKEIEDIIMWQVCLIFFINHQYYIGIKHVFAFINIR